MSNRIASVNTVSSESIFDITWRIPFATIGFLEAQAHRMMGHSVSRPQTPSKIKEALNAVKQRVENGSTKT